MYEKFAELLVKNNKTAYAVAKETGIAQSIFSDWKMVVAHQKSISYKNWQITLVFQSSISWSKKAS